MTLAELLMVGPSWEAAGSGTHRETQQTTLMYVCNYIYSYGTDLMQRRTRTRVLGYHSPSARTRSSLSFNGLELGLELELERKLERAV